MYMTEVENKRVEFVFKTHSPHFRRKIIRLAENARARFDKKFPAIFP